MKTVGRILGWWRECAGNRWSAVYGGIFFVAASVMAIVRYRTLNASVYDLGVFENAVYRIAGGEFSLLFGHYAEPIPYTHIEPILAVHSLVYFFFPFTETLLLLQTLTLAVCFLVVQWILKLVVGDAEQKVFLTCFFLAAPLWYNALFDFHTDHSAIVLGLLALFFMIRKRPVAFVITAFLLATVKENFVFTSALLALLYAYRERSRAMVGVFLFLSATATVLVAVYLPTVNPAGQEALFPAFRHLGRTVPEILATLAGRPWALLEAVSFAKVKYLILSFGPQLFLSLAAPSMMIPSLFSLFFIMLSANDSHYCICTQYTSGIFPYAFVAAVYGYAALTRSPGLARIPTRAVLFAILVASLAAHVMDAPTPASRIFYKENSNFNRRMLQSVYATDVAVILRDSIPGDAVVSTHNLVYTSSLGKRRHLLAFPSGVTAAAPFSGVAADYVVLDLNKPAYVVDRVDPEGFALAVEELERRGRKLYDAGGFMIYRMSGAGTTGSEDRPRLSGSSP